MNNYQFLKKYISLQQDIMFDEVIELPFAKICYCKIDNSPFWNNALVNSIISDLELSNLEKEFYSLKRSSALYFEKTKELAPLELKLVQKGYKQEAEDSLMFYSGEDINTNLFEDVKKVTNEEELAIFLHTFDLCYRKDDPLNPYGELGEYLKSAEISWKKHHQTNRIEYFIVYQSGKPVAVSTLSNFDGIGYISNVGSVLSVRGQGFGKLATLYCVDHSKKNGNSKHCLATEAGTNPYYFYTALGFIDKFSCKLMVKK